MRIILFLLKCLVGIFATVGLLVVAAAVGAGLFWRDIEDLKTVGTKVPDATVLTLDLAAGVVEARPDNFLSRASLGEVIVLRDAVQALERARRDPRVAGLLISLGHGNLGMAQVQELRGAIADFAAGDKFVMAFAESFGEGGDGTLHYYLASVADEVWVQPSGDLDLTGFMIEGPYLRGALDRIGVEPQLAQREEYKGFMNTFTDTALPAPQRENLQRLVDSWLGQVADAVAAARGLSPARVRELIDLGPHGGADGQALGLIDELGYWDQVNEAAMAAADTATGGKAEFLRLERYGRATEKKAPDASLIALVYGLGEVTFADRANDPVFGEVVMGAQRTAEAIGDAIDDPEVAAIVFRVDSPGGSYVASDTIWRQVQRARDEGNPARSPVPSAWSPANWPSRACGKSSASPGTGSKPAPTPISGARTSPSPRRTGNACRPFSIAAMPTSPPRWPRAGACRRKKFARWPRAGCGAARMRGTWAWWTSWAATQPRSPWRARRPGWPPTRRSASRSFPRPAIPSKACWRASWRERSRARP
jgi:protease-4